MVICFAVKSRQARKEVIYVSRTALSAPDLLESSGFSELLRAALAGFGGMDFVISQAAGSSIYLITLCQ